MWYALDQYLLLNQQDHLEDERKVLEVFWRPVLETMINSITDTIQDQGISDSAIVQMSIDQYYQFFEQYLLPDYVDV